MTTRFLFIFLLTFTASAQDNFAIDAVRQTLPMYLDENPNSVFSMLEGGKTYKLARIMSESAGKLDQFIRFTDSMRVVTQKNKVKVKLHKNWHSYEYAPDAETWKYDRAGLVSAFRNDSFSQSGEPIDTAYIDLIKKQIDTKLAVSEIDFNSLENPRYSFSDQPADSISDPMVFNGLKLYRPVFNDDKTKGCYLFSFACRSGYCRDFIFIALEDGKWRYVTHYPTHLVDGKDEE